ncbi:hypothetical protein UFOVP229_15 [uncultured Caudovirales phage]|uniref:Uncharacterized protein n=1 Tax=uncultured Caudovirales phage TaxID=2100421 RepID=A0A6J7WQI1_9CAUD|nr:hypothetical protein UFOVP229_15 [uncultured Caudovirales phage]
MSKKYQYYSVDVGFFPLPVAMCFNAKVFNQILKDYNVKVTEDPQAFELGMAETHSFSTTKESVVIVGYDLKAIGDNPARLAGTIAHEASHVITRLLEHIGEDADDFGEETRAYLMQHLVEQMFAGCILEIAKDGKREERRAKARQKDKGQGRPVPEVDKPRDDGGPGQAGVLSGPGDTGGAEVLVGGVVSAADLSDLTTTYVWRPDVGAFVVRGS